MPEKNLEENKNYANNKFQLIATMIVTIALTSVSSIQAAPTVSSNPSEEAKNSVTTNDIARTFNNPVKTGNTAGLLNAPATTDNETDTNTVPAEDIARTFNNPATPNNTIKPLNNPVPTSNPDGTTNTSVPTKEIAKTFVSPGNNTNPASPK